MVRDGSAGCIRRGVVVDAPAFFVLRFLLLYSVGLVLNLYLDYIKSFTDTQEIRKLPKKGPGVYKTAKFIADAYIV